MAAINHIGRGFLGQWSRRRLWSPRLRWEEPRCSLAGEHWWDVVGSWRRISTAASRCHGMSSFVDPGHC